ncbi:MAG: ShlB/FhaC/HecB family hemolysin secretion/activation protein [Lacunisphaera sp.]
MNETPHFMRKLLLSCFLGLIAVADGLSQASSQVNAGQLLEQQRRLEQSQRSAQPGVPSKVLTSPGSKAIEPASSSSSGTVKVVVKEFRLRGNTLLGEAELQAVVRPWVGRSVDLDDLRAATAALIQHYRQRGWLAQVSLPAQDITEGIVVLDIIEAKTGNIQFHDAHPDRPLSAPLTGKLRALLAKAVPADEPLNLFALERGLLIADEFPGVSVNGSLTAGAVSGSTDLLVMTAPDLHPFQTTLSADNAGLRATGAGRVNLQVSVNSLFERGEQFDLFASKTSGSGYLRIGATWPLALPIGTGWRIGVNASALHYRVLDDMNITTGQPPEGTSQTFGVDLRYSLIRTPFSSWTLSAGYEEARLRNEDDNEILNVLSVTNRTQSPTFTVGFYGNRFDRWAGGGVTSASLFFDAGRLSLDGSPAWYLVNDGQTAHTEGGFQKLRWSASRLQTLGQGFALFVSGNGQFADQNLDPSEKFYLGGIDGVRAYPGGEANGSTGGLLSVELRKQLHVRWEASAFYDGGQVELYRHNHAPGSSMALAADNHVALQGAGLSLSWRGNHGIQLKATWATRIGSNPLATPSGTDTDGSHLTNRFWFNAAISF